MILAFIQYFLMFISETERERGTERERESLVWTERERDTESKAGSRL